MQGFCPLSAVPMRREPSDRSEMVNQLLEGDTFQILRQEEKWSLIQCDYDGYQGWVDNKQWQPVPEGVTLSVNIKSTGATSPSEVALNQYLHTPYLWGGRSRAGIDCSGLTQVCFKACGIRLLRDASQQATQGHPVDFEEVQKDDLAFFSNPEGKIIHVGIILDKIDPSIPATAIFQSSIFNLQFLIIHSSGEVRIDTLDQQGILNLDTNQYTHHLHSIRRMIG